MSKFLATYCRLLYGSDTKRYQTKIALCGGIDPYEVCINTTDNSFNLATNVTREDLFEYLVLSTERYSLKQLKSFKVMDGHNFVLLAHLKHISFLKFPEKIGPLFSANWVLVKDSGEVINTCCNCMAGNGSSCSHIGAVLFAVETVAARRMATTCISKENTWLPPTLKYVEPYEIRQSNFKSSDKQFEMLQTSTRTNGTLDNKYQMYNGHPGIEELIKQLKANIFGASKNALTHVQLTEKTWLTFCLKMWESVKKSSFFVEYTKLMP